MFAIDMKARIPIYEQLEKHIIRLISLGLLQTDEQLPSVRVMAQELGINPNTVQKTYRALEQKGYIYTTAGRGAFVSDTANKVTAMQALAKEKVEHAARLAMEAGVSLADVNEIVSRTFKEESV